MAKFESSSATLFCGSAGEDGFADDVYAVGKVDSAVGVRVDDALNVIADIFPCFRFNVIGDDDVASLGGLTSEQCCGHCQEQGEEEQ